MVKNGGTDCIHEEIRSNSVSHVKCISTFFFKKSNNAIQVLCPQKH